MEPLLPSVALMGALHGLNPAMGWLFAVARGLQERRLGALLGALGPIALGHTAAVGVMLAPLWALDLLLPTTELRPWLGLGLIGFALWRSRKPWHPVGRMRAGALELSAWSFLLTLGHGAGLMLLPFLCASGALRGLEALAVHSLSTLLVMALAALLAYRLGLHLLPRLWINFDRVWLWALGTMGLASLGMGLAG
ncbi:hypothetical protein DV704_07395 [Meiothermus sp. QL-1]|uniref:hypothetical protein n=1 Tax=Meiothermus sp. QL-1 TaxID=2058095 RepID=UPI000E0B64D5|nr:hypothetical protein [Meiothermus sp. QL-1]RDI95387.1 hypothetical protein DV704_07395 [Meiothermus sp. QL-1]